MYMTRFIPARMSVRRLPPRRFAKRGLGMIKKIESYPELADPQLQPRYSGIPTFFRLPHSVRLDEVDIGLVGVPFDGGVTNRPGARHGPRDIRNQSSLIRKINQATGVALGAACAFSLAIARQVLT